MRNCNECKKAMIEGYCIDNGLEYYCSDECLHKHYDKEVYHQMYLDGDAFYTEWTDITDEELDEIKDIPLF